MPTTQLPIGRRLLFGGITLIILAVFFELVLQVFYFATVGDWLVNRTDLAIFEEDETRCYRVKSDLAQPVRTNEFDVTIYTNGQGMRTDSRRLDISIEKPKDVYRILLLGPSFTFGWGNEFEESYGTLIGEILRKSGLAVEIINLGTPAQGPEAQLCWLLKEGYLFEPDMVIQTTYGSKITTVVGRCPETLTCPHIENSRIYYKYPTLRRKLIARIKKLGTVFYGFYLYHALLAEPSDDVEVETGKELYSERARQSLASGREAFVEDFRRYRRVVQDAVSPDTQVVFLFLPVSYVVYPEDVGRWSHITEPDPMGARREIADAASALRVSGVDLIDATPTLIAHADPERLYYWLDIHLTPAGNRVVAEAMIPHLTKLIQLSADDPESLLRNPGQ